LASDSHPIRKPADQRCGRSTWIPGRVIALVAGAVLLFVSAGCLVCGSALRVITWRAAQEGWTIVVTPADGGDGISADVRLGATLPGLPWIAGAVLGTGALLLGSGGLLVGLTVRRVAQPPPSKVRVPGSPPAPDGPGAAEPVLTGGPTR